MPDHHILDEREASPATRQALADSLVLVHGGMAQNVGPILEMVTEKYLLRSEREWEGRASAMTIVDQILTALAAGDVPAVGALTTKNFFEPLQSIIPWATNFYTETLINRTRKHFGADFHGFWMLGGMSERRHGFRPKPKSRSPTLARRADDDHPARLEHALPFAMEPVVYDFAINDRSAAPASARSRSGSCPALRIR